MKFYYSTTIAMKKESFFVLAIIVFWIGACIWAMFWWSSSKKDMEINNTSSWTWFTKELLETWNNKPDNSLNNSWNSEINSNSNEKKYFEIKVLMPRYFYNAWRKSFAEDLYEEQKQHPKPLWIPDTDPCAETDQYSGSADDPQHARDGYL